MTTSWTTDEPLARTPEELLELDRKPNPVHIAGYGRESTHKGYLSWMLSEDRWPEGAFELLQAIQEAAGGGGLPREPRRLFCDCEIPLRGGKKVDLLAYHEKAGDGRAAIPIELKTDSAPTREQFEALSSGETTQDGYPIALRLAFLLGASSLVDFDPARFVKVRPRELLAAGRKLAARRELPGFASDWFEAVAVEEARRVLAHEVLVSWRKDEFFVSSLGYRTLHVFHAYVCDRLRDSLLEAGVGTDWSIGIQPHNSTLCLNDPDLSWLSLRGHGEAAQAYFEFSGLELMLKIWVDRSVDRAAVREVVRSLQQQALSISGPDLPVVHAARMPRPTSEYFSALGWAPDLDDLHRFNEQIRAILGKFGGRGLLGEFIEP